LQIKLNLKEQNTMFLEIIPKVQVKDSYSLSLVYTPGVGTVSSEIADAPEKSFILTNRANSIAIISLSENPDKLSAIANIEKKCCIYKQSAGIDAYPLLLSEVNLSEAVNIIMNLEPSYAGIVLTGISDEKFFYIKKQLELQGFKLPLLLDNENEPQTAETLRNLLGKLSDNEINLPSESDNRTIGEKSVELHEKAKGVLTTKVSEVRATSLKENLVAVISDGSAVLGLGNIGAEAAMPVMEGKSVLFKSLGNVDAVPICLKTQDSQELIEIISKLSPVLGGINLEDISAPRCFEIEKALIEKLDIPVFHDDQHGTAVVVLAGFINALKLTGKKVEELKVVVNGAGAGAIAVSKLLMNYGVKNLILCDRTGAIFEGRLDGMNPFKEEMAKITNPNKEKGKLSDVIKNADFFVGLSSAGAATKDMIASMAERPVVFALANPVPEIMPQEAVDAGAFIVATGRSDFKNQVNNSLAFPGIFRGTFDAKAKRITDNMKIAAAWAIANLITDEELSPDYIIPHALDLRVPPAVAKAVAEAAFVS
jgi:malate dehydrogenase (oxaloacetate-decarboxylating)